VFCGWGIAIVEREADNSFLLDTVLKINFRAVLAIKNLLKFSHPRFFFKNPDPVKKSLSVQKNLLSVVHPRHG
jgi:hypothetical protein